MRIPKQMKNVDRSFAVAVQNGDTGGVTASGAACAAFPETCGLGL